MLASLRRPASRPARSSSRWLSSTVSRHNNTTWNTPPSPYAHSDSTPIARRTEPPGAKPSSISLTAAQANALKIVEFPVEADPLLHFMSSLIMKDGKRKTADRSISRMLLHIHAMTRNPPLEILRVAIQKASPFVRTVPIRRAAKMVHYPAALSEKQRVHRGINSILEACDKRPGQTIAERLAREVIAIAIAETPEENEVLMKKKREHEFVMVNRCVKSHKPIA